MSAPEVRIDQLTGLRAILAPGRAERPEAFAPSIPEARPGARESCPFCEGREDRTPPELWADRPGGEPDTPGWLTRSVPNLYPALGGRDAQTEASAPAPESGGGGISATIDPLKASRRSGEADLFRAVPAGGAHEVIVHGPEHATGLVELGSERLEGAVAAWRERMRAHPEAAYVQLIVNEGPDAGASLEHSHSQLYALDFVPAAVARERERAAAYHQRTMGAHLLADVLTEEVRRGERLVAIDDEAALICPWASRSPFHLRIVPRAPAPRFELAEGGAAMLGRALKGLAALFGASPQLNLWVRTAPRGIEELVWHIDLVPRLTVAAGFELGTEIDINVYPPERAAADLRTALEGL